MSKKRSSEHRRAQREGKKRDNYTCQICGSTENTQGHHAFDVQFDGKADAENIVTLCDSCHKKAHRGLLDLFIF